MPLEYLQALSHTSRLPRKDRSWDRQILEGRNIGVPGRINGISKGLAEGPCKDDCLEMGGSVGPAAMWREKTLEGR